MELSHDTALCLVPPESIWPLVDRLRSLHDKAIDTWPPHLNLVYPFVRPEALSAAARLLGQVDLVPRTEASRDNGVRVRLDEPHTFTHKAHSTVVLRPEAGQGKTALSNLRDHVQGALGRRMDSGESFQPHMTIGQSQDDQTASHKFFLEKVRLLAPIEWEAVQLTILVRDTASHRDGAARPMKFWGCIDLRSGQLTQTPPFERFSRYVEPRIAAVAESQPQAAYQFTPLNRTWQSISSTPAAGIAEVPNRLIVASYNVLAEFEWPPDSSRYPFLVANILSTRAAADILVLQEVTDSFLPFVLANDDVRSRYPFSTHGPPDQSGIGPLPSLLNVVVMSRFPLQWAHLPFQRKHKGAAVVTFPTLQIPGAEDARLPLILAACHLSQGLVDGAVVAKMNELKRLLYHLSTVFPHNPWVIAGDFNLATSSYTINMARKAKDLSPDGQRHLGEIADMLSNAGLQDAWLATRVESGESSNSAASQQDLTDLHQGEQGATFDPLTNTLAAKLVGSGLNNRPQRYDRIMVGKHLSLRPRGFNMFGQSSSKPISSGSPCHASDHWGIRCLLVLPDPEEALTDSASEVRTVSLRNAPASLGGFDELKDTLISHSCLPTAADEAARNNALGLLKRVLVGDEQTTSDQGVRSGFSMVLVPVGSFGLGVWTASSDVDCLCIGDISSRTFFALAVQKLRRAAPDGITILRKVKASSGTMLELDIGGVKFDLQYCVAPSIVSRWPEIMNHPPSDPGFALPLQTLSKLKPARDLYYLRRSIPDVAEYRLAHLAVKAWAQTRGLYAGKFGLLGGVHITAMLVPVCKVLAYNERVVSTADIVVSFFHHYADFDWKTEVVFDPFFHKNKKYHRSFREPLCLLGWHAPALNTALNASVPTVRTMAAEFARASSLLSQEGITWGKLLGTGNPTAAGGFVTGGASEFLQSYKSYVKIDARYWGQSPGKGRKFLGWLESRCVAVLVDMNRKVPALLPRIWPGRFFEGTHTQEGNSNPELHGCYLVGLGWNDEQAGETSKERVKITEGALQTTLQEFEMRIRRDEKYYDPNCCWMAASVLRSGDVGSLQLDESQWGNICDCDEYSDDDDDDDLDADEDMEEDEDRANYFDTPAKNGSKGSKRGNGPAIPKPPGLGKFRTATDVMNRLRWDPTMDAADYIVGYLDRFIGACERTLEQWKSDQTDEEFIPQHRILYFKRRSDGVMVWERRSRTDDVFGSGI